MKGMKKLFALLAVLTMALTLTPMVAPVAAADELTVEINGGETGTVLYVGGATVSLAVTKITQEGATINNPAVTYQWFVDDVAVATVDPTTASTTTLTPVGEGKTTVWVVVSYAGTTGRAKYEVTVNPNAVEVTIAPTELTLYTEAPGKTATVSATVKYQGEVVTTPVNAEWSVDVSGLVTFSATGATVTKVTAGSTTGTGIITFTATYNGLSESATIPVTVKAHTYTVTVTPTSLTLSPGQTAVLTPKVLWDDEPVEPTEYKWDVQQSGTIIKLEGNKVEAIANGNATITYTATYTPEGGTATSASVEVPVQVKEQTTILANAKGSWIEAGGTLYYQVKYDVINAPTSADHVELWYNGERLVEAALGSPISVSWTKLVEVMDYKAGMLTLRHKEGTSSVEVPVNFFKVESNLADSYKSGDYATISVTVSLVNGEKLVKENLPKLALRYGTTNDVKVIDLTISEDNAKIATGKVENFRFTGPKDAKWYLVENGADVRTAYALTKITQTAFKFSPADVTVTGTPEFKATVYITDANGKAIPAGTKLEVKYYYSDTASGTEEVKVAVEKEKSFFEITLPTPPKAGTYTATVTTKDPTRDQVDGKGTFTISLPGEIHMTDPALFTSTIGESVITVFAGEGKEDISKLWVTIDNPNGVVKKYVVDSASKVLVYKDGVYCEAPDPIDIYWTNINSSQANIKLNLVQGGSFKVTVKAQLKDGSTFSETKEYTNKMYRIESLTLTPTVPVYGKEAKMTLVVKDWAGDSVNNATITVDDRVVTPVEEVHGGKYVIDLGKALTDGLHSVEVYAGSTLMARKYFVAEGADTLKVTLTPTTVVAGKKVEGTVKDADGNLVNGTAVVTIDPVDEIEYEAPVVNGKFTIDTSDARFEVAKAYTVRVVDSAKKNIGTAEFTITLPLTVVSPTDGLVNNGIADSIVVTTTSGLSPAKVGIESSAIYVVEKGKLSVADAVSFLDDEYDTTVEDNKVTLDFVVGANPKITCAELILKYGNYTATTFKLALPKLEIVQTATWYMGDTVPLKVKLTDAHGNPVAGITATAQQLGYFNLTAKTGADGIADFGDVYLNAAGNVVASVKLFGEAADLEAKVTVLAARPTQALKVTVTPTIVDAGKDALLTLTLVGADDKPVETGKSVVVTIGPSTYNGLVGANGVVTLTVKAESLTGTVVTGVVKVEGYNAATFTLAVKEAEKPEVKTLIELAPGMDVYTVNGETKFWDATPYIKNGRTLVPIRHLAEAIGFKADWDFSDPANKMVFIYTAEQDPEKDKEHPFILLIIGQPTAMVNGNLVALDVAPEILNGRTMVPLRFVVETLGYQVEWLGNTIRLMK